MITELFATLALVASSPTAYLNSAPVTYDFTLRTSLNLVGSVDHSEGYLQAYANVYLDWYGSYDTYYNNYNIRPSSRIYGEVYYIGTDYSGVNEDMIDFEYNFTPSYGLTSDNAFRVTLDMEFGCSIFIDTPTLPDDAYEEVFREVVYDYGGGSAIYNSDSYGFLQPSGMQVSNVLSSLKSETDGYAVDNAYNQGYSEGYTLGYNTGLNADSTAATIFEGILAIGVLPTDMFLRMLNFDILGINMAGFTSGLITLSLVVFILGFLFGGKKE